MEGNVGKWAKQRISARPSKHNLPSPRSSTRQTSPSRTRMGRQGAPRSARRGGARDEVRAPDGPGRQPRSGSLPWIKRRRGRQSAAVRYRPHRSLPNAPAGPDLGTDTGETGEDRARPHPREQLSRASCYYLRPHSITRPPSQRLPLSQGKPGCRLGISQTRTSLSQAEGTGMGSPPAPRTGATRRRVVLFEMVLDANDRKGARRRPSDRFWRPQALIGAGWPPHRPSRR
jgi:hypothetical protein